MIFRILLIFTSFLSLISCDSFLKGKPKTQDKIEIKNAEFNCMKDVQTKITQLMDSKTQTQDVEKSFECLQKTLDQFYSKVEGTEQPDVFSNQDLFTIFDKFFKDAKISQSATDQILLLKSALLGGSESSISKTEIAKLKSYLIVLKNEVQKLLPYLKVYAFDKEKGPFHPDFITKAFYQLNSSMKTLLKESKMGRSEYRFEDLKQLIQSLDFLQDEKGQKTLALIENVINLLSGTEPLKTIEEYELAIDNFTDIAALYGELMTSQIEFAMTTPQNMDKIFNLTERLVFLLENSVQFKKTKSIPVKFIDPIVKEVALSGVLPVQLSEGVLLDFYKILLIRVFNDQKNLAIESFENIKELHFTNLKREIKIYKIMQQHINSLPFNSKNVVSVPMIKKHYQTWNIQEAVEKELIQNLNLLSYQLSPQRSKNNSSGSAQNQLLNSKSPNTPSVQKSQNSKLFQQKQLILDEKSKKEIIQALAEFKVETQNRFSIVYLDRKMVLALNQDTAQPRWIDLTQSLFTKMLAREMMFGWGKIDPSQELFRSSLTEEGFIKWYADFKPFATEIKLFDPRTVNNGARSFLEANLFTYLGDGDQLVNYYEILQFVGMLFSGGGEMTVQIRRDMKTAGCEINEVDVFGEKWLDEKCFKNRLRKNHKLYFSHIYHMSVFIDSLNENQFNEFYTKLMSVARNDDKIVGKIETADLRSLSMMLMYIEALYGRYDVEAPTYVFNAREIRASYPRFKQFVTDFAQKTKAAELEEWDAFYNVCKYSYTKEDFLREAFIFMVYTGELPVKEDMNYITCSQNGLFTFEGTVNRKTIINTFQVLKSVLASLDGKN